MFRNFNLSYFIHVQFYHGKLNLNTNIYLFNLILFQKQFNFKFFMAGKLIVFFFNFYCFFFLHFFSLQKIILEIFFLFFIILKFKKKKIINKILILLGPETIRRSNAFSF